jgi:hypothetical protein
MQMKRIQQITIGLLVALMPQASVQAQHTLNVNGSDGVARQVLVLPFDATQRKVDSALEEKGTVSTGKPAANVVTDFKKQLEAVAVKAADKGANVLQVTLVKDTRQSGRFMVEGTAYYTDQIATVTHKAQQRTDKKYDDGKYAYVTLYRPVYERGANDEHTFDIIVNDTLILKMPANTRYVLKLAREGNVRVAVENSMVSQNIDVKPGNSYYMRCMASFPGSKKVVKMGSIVMPLKGFAPYVELEDELQGSIESSLVNQVILYKNL